MAIYKGRASIVYSEEESEQSDAMPTQVRRTRPRRSVARVAIIESSSEGEGNHSSEEEQSEKEYTDENDENQDPPMAKLNGGTSQAMKTTQRLILDRIEVPLRSLSVNYQSFKENEHVNTSTSKNMPKKDSTSSTTKSKTPVITGKLDSFFKPKQTSILVERPAVDMVSRAQRKRVLSVSDAELEEYTQNLRIDQLITESSEEESKPKAKKAKILQARARTSTKGKDNKASTDLPASKWRAETAKDLPPLSSIHDMFRDMVSRHPDFVDVAKHLNGKTLRVATMCSGTESPLLALGMISEFMKKEHNATFNVEHVFSCEIEPFKQAYIERNFKPPILFRDIRELGQEKATTAYGAQVTVPGNCDLLVAGTSCVDFSPLNNRQKTLKEEGESGQTFRGMLAWVDNHRPKIVILENVCKAPWKEAADHFRIRGYSAIHNLFDTKDYYVPHTRTRGYLIAVDEQESEKPEEWVNLVKAMRRPASVTLEDFLLDPDDPRVHEARQKLIKDEAVPDKRNEWTACENRHARERFNLEVGRGRPLTKWQEDGKCTLPDFAWSDWGNAQVDRVCDLLDITFLKNAKKGIDVCYKTQMWNLSQNVDRNIEGSKTGICTCLTPTAIPYLTQRGGPMIGLEALSMQGLPVDQLLLTRESEKNLLDLAGNAMSSTVVGSAIMAALMVSKDLLEGIPQDGMDISKDETNATVQSLVGDDELDLQNLDLGKVPDVAIHTLLESANRSSRMCYCEGQSGITTNVVQRCQDCGAVSCEKCGRNPVHNYQPETNDRLYPIDFERQLKSALPMLLTITGVDLEKLTQLKGTYQPKISDDKWQLWCTLAREAFSSNFRFSTLKRQETWTVTYAAANGKLELHLDPLQPEWRLYACVNALEPGNSIKRIITEEPLARARFTSNSSNLVDCSWSICLPGDTQAELSIRGTGELVPSWEKSLGIVATECANKMVWSKLNIAFANKTDSALFDQDLGGTWTLLPECGTAARSLHKKDGDNSPPLYFFLDPTTTGEARDDGFVFSITPRRYLFREKRPVIARVDPKWRPRGIDHVEKVMCGFSGVWVPLESTIFTPAGELLNSATFGLANSELLTQNHHPSCRDAQAFLVCKAHVGQDTLNVWPDRVQEIDHLHAQEVFRSLSWLTEKIKSQEDLQKWRQIRLENSTERCQTCAPTPPDLVWQYKGRRIVPMEDTEQAGPYENALKARPLPWVNTVHLDHEKYLNLNIGLNLTTLAHRAISLIPAKFNLGDLNVEWRVITDYVQPTRLVIPPYTIDSNKQDQEHKQPPHFVQNLRPEQLRSLTWMMAQEADDVTPFIEEEVVEAYHEHMNWRVDVKAQRPNYSRGGILADEVGYGKTAISLGLIDCTHENYVEPTETENRIPLKATLVVVPAHLSDQWRREVAKFTGTKYKVVQLQSLTSLNSTSISDLQAADIIILSCTLFKSTGYLDNLALFAGSNDAPSSEGRRFDHWHEETLRKVVSQARTLQEHGAETVMDVMTISQRENAESATNMEAPSKRLKGAALVKDTAAKKSKTTKSKAKSKLEESDSEAWSDDAESEPSGSRKTAVKSTTVSRKARLDSDPWMLKSKAKKDWRWMRSAPLEIFYFNRIVVDEYTYLKGNIHAGIIGLKSKYKWVLSGTPPLGDFADIKSIAVFLGIHLGVDDDSAGTTANRKKVAKDRSAVEAFTAFHQKPTAAWHLHRYDVAQSFLDKFMRQNVAEIDEIPSEEFIVPIHLPAAERAIYLELEHHLLALDMMISRRGKAKTDSDRDKRLSESIGSSTSAEEALLKKCSHFALDEVQTHLKGGNAPKACDIIVQDRETQLEANKQELKLRFVEALKLYAEAKDKNPHPDDDLPFKEFLNRQRSTGQDPEGKTIIHELIDEAQEEAKRSLSEGTNKKGKADGRAPSKKSKRVVDSDDEDFDAPDDEKPEKPLAVDPVFELKTKQSQLIRLIKELNGRVRSLRYFKVVREMQKERLSKTHDFGTSILPGVECLGCGKKELVVNDVAVSSGCGHVGCYTCLVERAYNDDACPLREQGCEYAARSSNIVKVNSLGVEEENDKKGKHYGVKLEKIIDHIQNVIPKNDKILVFVQFPDLMDKVSEAFDENKIQHLQIKGPSATKSKNLGHFQDSAEGTGPRVLLLNVTDESASGANLTNANHVIFISPLLTETLHTYRASETQAIGRVRRYGQLKKVHIYRFLTMDSIDVKIFEERTGRKVQV